MQLPNDVTVTINQRDVVKWLARQVVSRSVSTTISLFVSQNVRPEKKRHKVYIHVGAWTLGDMVGDLSEAYIDNKVDETIDSIKKAQAFVEKLKNSA